MTRKRTSLLRPDVVQRADVRMVERRDGAGLTFEPLARSQDRRPSSAGRTLIATIRSRRVSRAR